VRFVRIALIATVATLVVAIGVVMASRGWWWPKVEARVAAELGARVGGDVAITGLEVRTNGDVRVASIAIERDGVSIACQGVQTRVTEWRGDDGAPTVDDVVIEACAIERPAASAPSDDRDDDDDDARLVPDTAPLVAPWRDLHRMVPDVRIGTVTATTGSTRLDATDVHTRMGRVGGDGPRVTLQAEVERGDDRFAGAVDVTTTATGIAVTLTEATVRARGLAVGVPTVTVRIDDDTVTLASGALDALPIVGSIAWDHIAVTGPRDCPAIEARGIDVGADLLPAPTDDGPTTGDEPTPGDEPAPDDEPTTDGDDGDAPEAGEPEYDPTWPNALATRAHAAFVAGVDALDRLPGASGCPHVRVTDLRSGRAHIPAASLVDGVLTASVGVGGVFVDASVDLATRESVTFEARDLDLSPLGETTGVFARTAGTADVGGAYRRSDDGATFTGTLTVRDGLVEAPGVSPEPLHPLDANADLTIEATADAFSITGQLTLDGVTVAGAASLTRAEGPWALDLDVGVDEPTACNTLWQAIPEGLIPHLGHDGVTFSGEMAPTLSLTWTLDDPRSLRMRVDELPGTCEIVDIDRAYDPERLLGKTWTHAPTEGTERTDILVGPGSGAWVAYEDLPSYVPGAMHLSEEIGFWDNPGFDVGLINRALRLNLERGRYVYGGSTVTQQLVKNLFFSRAKTLSRKLEEAVVVWAMESALSKERILELYVNCIEFGPDVWGITEAARWYFDKDPWDLTPLEAVYLANLKPAPREGGVHQRRGHSPPRGWWIERTEIILQRLADHGHIDAAEIAAYAPYVIAIPTSPNFDTVEYAPIPRPPEFGGEPTDDDPSADGDGDPEGGDAAAGGDAPTGDTPEPGDGEPAGDDDGASAPTPAPRRTVPPADALRGLQRADDF